MFAHYSGCISMCIYTGMHVSEHVCVCAVLTVFLFDYCGINRVQLSSQLDAV